MLASAVKCQALPGEGRDLVKEIGKLAATPDYKIASQRRATGQSLTVAQKVALD